MIDNNLQINLQVNSQTSSYSTLSQLPRNEQLEYTSRLFTILKYGSISQNSPKWEDVQQLRSEYNLDPKTRDALRRGVLLNELVEADCLLDPTCFIPKDVNQSNITYMDPETGDAKQAHTGTRKMEIKFDSKLGDYIQSSEGVFPMTEEQSVNPEEIMKMHGYDPEKFNLLKCRTSVWQQGNKKDNVKTLYATKIEVAPKKEEEKPIDYKKLFEEVIWDSEYNISMDRAIDTVDYMQKQKEKASNPEDEKLDKTLLIMLSDCHLGRNSVYKETGFQQTLQSSIKALYDNIDKYIQKFRHYGIKQIILPFGNDYLNSSFTGSTSSQFHKQDNSTTTQEIYRQASTAMIVIIDKLSRIAPIHVPLVVGNHCRDEEYALSLMFSAYFRNNPNVTIDTSTTTRKYIKQDNVLICLSHGYDDKKNIQNIAMIEAQKDFGEAKNVYWFLGHEHHFSAEEMPHQEIYRVPSMTESDKWTESKGYRAKTRSMAFIFNEDELIETHFMSV